MKRVLMLIAALALPSFAAAGPSSAREDWVAVSFSVEIEEGETWGWAPYSLPVCSTGQFLITHVSSAPSLSFHTAAIADLGRWVLAVPVWQRIAGQGFTAGHSLALSGDGPGHAQVSLPGGQAAARLAGFANASQVAVYLAGGAAPLDLRFNVHVSGSCGQAGEVEPVTADEVEPRSTRSAR